MSNHKERDGKGIHRKVSKNIDRRVKDKERSSERNDYKNRLRNFVEGNYNHLNEDDLDEFQ